MEDIMTFQKGNKWRFKKGKHCSPKTEFRKGQISGSKHPRWKGERKISQGYVQIWNNKHPFRNKDNYIREHRLISEKLIGRYLLPEEKCPHLTDIKTDNRPKNLRAFTSESAHQRFHHNPKNVKPEEIIFDGRKLSNRNCSP